MRAISPYSRFTIQLIEAPVRRGPDATGSIVEWSEGKPVIAEFEKQGLHPWEQVAALEGFAFGGLAETVNPLSVLSVYDTEAAALQNNWTPDFKQKVEARLLVLAERNPSNFIVVAKPRTAAPWPAYDSQPLAEILTLLKVTQIDPDVVRIYEAENLNREDVIYAMEHYGEKIVTEEEIKAEYVAPQTANFHSSILEGRQSTADVPKEIEVVA
jgi:hypothetical protein